MPRVTQKRFGIRRLGKERCIQQLEQIFQEGDYIRHIARYGGYITINVIESFRTSDGVKKYRSDWLGDVRGYNTLAEALENCIRWVDRGALILCMRNP